MRKTFAKKTAPARKKKSVPLRTRKVGGGDRRAAGSSPYKKKGPPRGVAKASAAQARGFPPFKKKGPRPEAASASAAQARGSPPYKKKRPRPEGAPANAALARGSPPYKRKLPSPEAAPTNAAPARAEAPAELSDEARPRALDIARVGLDKKAEDVLVLDVRGLTSYADYFVLMTADSDRQAGAIADAVDETLKERGATKVGVEGYESGRWILIDYGDVVAHVFNRESRGFYDLEGLWADAPRFAVEG
jgi:ribosome-associated protein